MLLLFKAMANLCIKFPLTLGQKFSTEIRVLHQLSLTEETSSPAVLGFHYLQVGNDWDVYHHFNITFLCHNDFFHLYMQCTLLANNLLI